MHISISELILCTATQLLTFLSLIVALCVVFLGFPGPSPHHLQAALFLPSLVWSALSGPCRVGRRQECLQCFLSKYCGARSGLASARGSWLMAVYSTAEVLLLEKFWVCSFLFSQNETKYVTFFPRFGLIV